MNARDALQHVDARGGSPPLMITWSSSMTTSSSQARATGTGFSMSENPLADLPLQA